MRSNTTTVFNLIKGLAPLTKRLPPSSLWEAELHWTKVHATTAPEIPLLKFLRRERESIEEHLLLLIGDLEVD